MTLPQEIFLSDTVRVGCPAPEAIAAGSEWASAKIVFAKQQESPIAPVEVDGTSAGDDNYTFLIDASQLSEGVWNWALQFTDDRDRVKTDRRGTLIASDAAPSKSSHARKMVGILEDTIEKKMSGRGDIVNYTIGDRQIGVMSLAELKQMLDLYRSELQRSSSRIRRWQSWQRPASI